MFHLNNGNIFPLIGCKYFFLNTTCRPLQHLNTQIVSVGTFRIQGAELIRTVVDAALNAGYRSFGKIILHVDLH